MIQATIPSRLLFSGCRDGPNRTRAASGKRFFGIDTIPNITCAHALVRRRGAAVTMHTLLDLRGNIPSFVPVSDGKLHDVHALDLLLPEAGAIYVMDRGYVDFGRLYRLHQAGAFFVTRAKSNMVAHRVYSAPVDRATGIICDQSIALDGPRTRQDYRSIFGGFVFGIRKRKRLWYFSPIR